MNYEEPIYRNSATVAAAFAKADLAFHPGFEGFYYHPYPGVSDFDWFRYDGNDATETRCGIQLFDQCDWTPIEECAGFTVEDVDILKAQIPSAIPLNEMTLEWNVRDKLPGIVQDIWSGRFASIAAAKAEDDE